MRCRELDGQTPAALRCPTFSLAQISLLSPPPTPKKYLCTIIIYKPIHWKIYSNAFPKKYGDQLLTSHGHVTPECREFCKINSNLGEQMQRVEWGPTICWIFNWFWEGGKNQWPQFAWWLRYEPSPSLTLWKKNTAGIF